MSDKIYKTGIYARLSREDADRMESNSIQSQRAICLAYIEGHDDLELVDTYIDDGETGSNTDRPGFQKMIQDMRSGRIDCAVSKDLSRFSRNYIDAGNYLEKIFPAMGIRYIAINDNYDSMAPGSSTDVITLPFKNLVNDIYCRDISIKIRTSLEVKRKKGEYVGSFVPFGYRKAPQDKNRLLVDETAAEVVSMIFGMYKDGFPILKIARRLNTSGIPTPMEYKRMQGVRFETAFRTKERPEWEYVTVKRILSNIVYTGVLIQGRRGTPNHKVRVTRPKDEADWVRIENAHEPIISCTDFEAVAELMRRDMRCAGDSDKHDLFSGYLFCGDCEGAMIRKTHKAKGRAYVYYNCGNNKRTHQCSPHSFSEAKLADIVFHAIHDQIEVVLHLDKVLCFIDSLPQRDRRVFSYEAQMTRLEEEIQRYKKLELGLYENFVEGIINKEEYTDFRENYRGLIEEKQEALKRLKREQQDAAAMGSQNRAWVQVFAQYENVQELDRRLLLALVDKIFIYEDKRVKIVFRYRDEFARAMETAKSYKDCPLPAVG
ncbi:recombinase family protein [Enterocloster clostridioformis]|uniref:recombinase family protein n=2 Tax=Enterocloster clostridioformis TaxID=1531 RepID=UPI0034A55661